MANGCCSGGRGISIGSVGGSNNININVLKRIIIMNSTFVNSDNGVHFKTIYGATGYVSVDTYNTVIQDDYRNGSPVGAPIFGVSNYWIGI